MLRHLPVPVAILLAVIAFAGCSKSSSSSVAADPRYLLPTEPSASVGVVDFKDMAKTGQTVSVIGRVGGGVKPWIEGRAAFLLVDTGAPLPCADSECGPECQHCAQELASATMVVKFVDEQGKTIAVDSRQLLGINEEETVVVQGIAKRDDEGNVALMASGIFIKR
jgi:hypothetical protein